MMRYIVRVPTGPPDRSSIVLKVLQCIKKCVLGDFWMGKDKIWQICKNDSAENRINILHIFFKQKRTRTVRIRATLARDVSQQGKCLK